ncbi:O-antigen polymerase [Thiopseudomonas alkaliphila]|uniref:O-antigen polymerase n=1 Tax=Thiopseudomonas alkaliphila TaxID=1697053 RepID=UPI00069CCDAB|nr:O-antigen polymerase [Thiopseudomonas alkaliphila]AKX52909.1 hypothetical protein AKN91_03930 [Thiopseudomonas alkaliphila]
MTLTLALVFHIILAIEITFIEVYKRKKGLLFFDFLTIANIFFLLSYSITPLFYLVFSDKNILPDILNADYIAALSFFSYHFFLLGWLVAGGLKFQTKKLLPSYALEFKWFKLGVIFLFITIFLMILTVVGKGGVVNSLGGALSRYSFEDVDSGGFAFLSRLTNVAPFLTSIFFYFLIQKNIGFIGLSKKMIKILFYISLGLSLFQVFSGASRGGMLRLFVLLGFIYILVENKIKLLPTAAIAILIFIFIMYGKQTFYAVSNLALNNENFSDSFHYLNEVRSNAQSTESDIVFREFSHPYKSMDTAIRYNSYYSYTYFKDFLWSIFRILPGRFTSIFVERPVPINVINTTLMTGIPGAGGVPPGLIASFYYSLGVLGALIGCFLYGVLGRCLNVWLFRMMRAHKIYCVPFAFFSYYFGFFIANGDPNIYIYYILMPVVFILSLKIVSARKVI